LDARQAEPVHPDGKHTMVRQGAWGGQLSIPTSAAATEDTPTQIALASLISSQLLSLPGASVAPAADDRDSVTSTSTLAALRMTPAVAGADVLASTAAEYTVPRRRHQEVRPDLVLSAYNLFTHIGVTSTGVRRACRCPVSSSTCAVFRQRHHDVRRCQPCQCLHRAGASDRSWPAKGARRAGCAFGGTGRASPGVGRASWPGNGARPDLATVGGHGGPPGRRASVLQRRRIQAGRPGVSAREAR